MHRQCSGRPGGRFVSKLAVRATRAQAVLEILARRLRAGGGSCGASRMQELAAHAAVAHAIRKVLAHLAARPAPTAAAVGRATAIGRAGAVSAIGRGAGGPTAVGALSPHPRRRVRGRRRRDHLWQTRSVASGRWGQQRDKRRHRRSDCRGRSGGGSGCRSFSLRLCRRRRSSRWLGRSRRRRCSGIRSVRSGVSGSSSATVRGGARLGPGHSIRCILCRARALRLGLLTVSQLTLVKVGHVQRA